jgi:hypothetical protein
LTSAKDTLIFLVEAPNDPLFNSSTAFSASSTSVYVMYPTPFDSPDSYGQVKPIVGERDEHADADRPVEAISRTHSVFDDETVLDRADEGEMGDQIRRGCLIG